MLQYLIANGPMQTTSKFAPVTTGTGLKTMLQVKPGIMPCKILEWGYSFDGFAAAQPGSVELIETDVAATVTAIVAADITKRNGDAIAGGDPTTAMISAGTSATGYTATVEGSIAAVRNLGGPGMQAPTNMFVQQFPLGQEPLVQAAKFMRIRVHFGTAVNMVCYVVIGF